MTKPSGWLWLMLLVGCGARTNLFTDAPELGSGGATGAGTASTLGGAGSAAGGASLGGVSPGGSSPRGGSPAEAGEGGEAGDPSCPAVGLARVSPRNAENDVTVSEPLRAFYSCPPARNLAPQASFRVRGAFTGPLAASYRRPAGSTAIELYPRGYDDHPANEFMAGDLVTGWLGSAFGGPYLWQFRTAVHAGSSARFVDTGQALPNAEQLSLGDLDHDGDLDLVTSSPAEKLFRVWHNDGRGQFVMVDSMIATGLPLLADLDGDGYLDIAANRLFGEMHEVFDADGDGDSDVFSVANGTQWALHRNDGTGDFYSEQFGGGSVFDAKVGDLDNDGDLDLVVLALVATNTYRGEVLLNDGAGHFREIAAGLEVDASRSLALGDLEGDGDLDVIIGNWGAPGARNPPNQVWLNDGSARFSKGDSPLSGSVQIVLGDLDGDGDLDAIAGQHAPYSTSKGDPSAILLNDGNGRFAPLGNLGGSNFQRVALGDLDGDGDLDAVVAQWDWTLKPAAQVWLQSP